MNILYSWISKIISINHNRFALLFLIILLSGLYFSVASEMITTWDTDPAYSHGFLIPIVSVFLIWRKRNELSSLPIKSNIWGLSTLGFGCLLFLVGSIGAIFFLQGISLIVTLFGLLHLLFGVPVLRYLAFPVGFLIFMVPLPNIWLNAVSLPLQLFAAKTATFSLFNFGIPVLREGNIIVLSQMALEISEACSGLRSLEVLVALGTLYAYLTQESLWKRLTLILLSIPIAIGVNALRVSGTGMLIHYFGKAVAEDFYHYFSGWLLFVLAFAILVSCNMCLTKIRSTEAV